MTISEILAAVLYLLIILLWVVGIIGYVLNIIKLLAMLTDPALTPMFVARCVGIFPPLGAILGWF